MYEDYPGNSRREHPKASPSDLSDDVLIVAAAAQNYDEQYDPHTIVISEHFV